MVPQLGGNVRIGGGEDAKPEKGFSGLLQCDRLFSDEIPLRLATGRFFKVRSDRSRCVQQLIGKPTHDRVIDELPSAQQHDIDRESKAANAEIS